MLIQGTNSPLVIQFDQDVSTMAKLVITLWSLTGELVREWDLDEITVQEDTAICPLTEDETKAFPNTIVTIEAKGLDEMGEMVFWDQMDVKMVKRRDKVISLVDDESE